MKPKLILSILSGVLLLSGCGEQLTVSKQEAKLETKEQKVAYAMGASVGHYLQTALKKQNELGVTLDHELISKGVLDSLKDSSKMTKKEITEVLTKHDEELKPLLEKKKTEDMAINKKKGEEYMTKNSTKEGVQITESGLQYEVIEKGDVNSKLPTLEDEVTVHYTGKLIDGTVFDSSVERGEPVTFPLGGVIQGWQEGLQLMHVGAKYTLTIPAKLGYGDRAAGSIPASSVLVFEVELLKIGK